MPARTRSGDAQSATHRLRLTDPVAAVRGVGPRRAEELRRHGVETVADLLHHLPFRYEDRAAWVPVRQLRPGKTGTVEVELKSCRLVRRGRRTRVQGRAGDASGSLDVVWFNQPWLARGLKRGRRLRLHGRASSYEGRLQMVNPVLEDAGAEALHVGRLVPVYRRLGALGPALLRRLTAAALDVLGPVEETLPASTRQRLRLVDRDRALRDAHRPPDDAEARRWQAAASPAHRRLVVEEFLAFHLALRWRRGRDEATGIRFSTERVEGLIAEALPFAPTPGQRRALSLILDDMAAGRPMHRLLQGDVGSGKTAVAAVAMLLAARDGWQAALLVPTEILAEQQARSLSAWAGRLGLEVGCITAGRPAGERRRSERALARGELRLVVGTHALLEPGLDFARLGLAVVDEQQRFGVRQRAALSAKGTEEGRWPDLLVMSATPIPRSLALALYGDLDHCTIDDLPPGRRPVRTEALPARRWDEAVEVVRATVEREEQAFVVAPRIGADGDDLGAAVALQDDLRRRLPDVGVGLLHGAMSADEKSAAMRDFVAGRSAVLAATTVVEVGVDVPAATLMVVDHAERFGLAQLHQLRGRVGRGSRGGRCLLVAHPPLSDVARARLQALVSTSDGFVIAERDLELRGPGEVLGTLQAGVPELRVGDPFRDRELLVAARREAAELAASDEPLARQFRRRARRDWLPRLAPLQAG